MGLVLYVLTKGVTKKRFNYIVQAYVGTDDYIGTYFGVLTSPTNLSVLMAEAMVITDLVQCVSTDLDLSVTVITNTNRSYQYLKNQDMSNNVNIKLHSWNSTIFVVMGLALNESWASKGIEDILVDYRSYKCYRPDLIIYTDASIDDSFKVGAYALIITENGYTISEESESLVFESKESAVLCEGLGLHRAIELADTVYRDKKVLIVNDCKELVCGYQILRREDSRIMFKWSGRNSSDFLARADRLCGIERRKKCVQ